VRRHLLLALWLVSDLLLFVAAYVFAYFLRVGWIFSSDLPFWDYLRIVCGVAPLWLLVLVTTRTFGLTRSQQTARNLAYIAYACVMGAALMALAYFFLENRVFSRLLLLDALALSTVAVCTWHILFDAMKRRALRRDPPSFPTLIVGVTRESQHLLMLLQAKLNPLKPVAILDGAGCKETAIAGVPVLGKLNKLETVLEEYGITHLIQCSDLEQSINLLGACRARGITYLLLPSLLGIVERDERIESLEGKAVTVVSPHQHWLQWFFR
jgi:FlaA1/EpsC-like NDP-sugar epimerase